MTTSADSGSARPPVVVLFGVRVILAIAWLSYSICVSRVSFHPVCISRFASPNDFEGPEANCMANWFAWASNSSSGTTWVTIPNPNASSAVSIRLVNVNSRAILRPTVRGKK